MLQENDVRDRVNQFLSGMSSINDLANWVSKEVPSIRHDDDDLFNTMASIQTALDMHFDRVLGESELRSELRKSILSNEIQEQAIRFVFDDEPVEKTVSVSDLKSLLSSPIQNASFAPT